MSQEGGQKLYFSIGKSCAIICAVREETHMADILLRRDSKLAATYIPNTFIDEYMTHADGEFVKIYLYLLRCMNNPGCTFSISDIADKFDHTEKDVIRALRYWEKMHLLCLEFDSQKELTGICLSDYTSAAPASAAAMPAAARSSSNCLTAAGPKDEEKEEAKALSMPDIPERMEYTRQELAHFDEDETAKELLFVAERYLGHPLNYTELQTILYWLDKLHLSQDMIDYLIEQCVAKNHANIWYMNSIAISWAKKGIHTLCEAKQEAAVHSNVVYCVIKAFGIFDRSLGSGEMEYIQRWSDEMGFSDEIITLACQKSLMHTHKASFSYANSILTNWQKQNVRTLNDIELLDAQYQEKKARQVSAGKTASARTAKGTLANGFANFTQRTYNYEELERELLSQVR